MIENGRYVPSAAARWAMLGAALVLAWISARSAIQSEFQFSDPQTAAEAWPANGASLAEAARLRVAATSGEIDDATRSLYQSALAREPLLGDPLALAGLDAANAGDGAKAEQLMLAARERDPRSAIVRFWLLDHFVRTGQYARALDEVGPAVRLQGDAITAIMTVLAAMASTPEGNAELARKLATHPFWETSFFQTAAKSTPAEPLLALLSKLPNAGQALDEQRAVYLALIDAGDGGRAFETWRQLLPATYRAQTGGVYDGNFSRWPGATPFNWMLTNDTTGTARMVSAGDLPQSSALEVRYLGSSPATLAEQLLYMKPGNYRLQLAARRRSSGPIGGQLNMELRCLRGDRLATLPLSSLSPQLQSFSTPVTVPAGCDMLRLRFVGSPGELFSEIDAQITGVALVPAA